MNEKERRMLAAMLISIPPIVLMLLHDDVIFATIFYLLMGICGMIFAWRED